MGRGSDMTNTSKLRGRMLLSHHKEAVAAVCDGADWQMLETHPWVRAMAATEQDARHHREGDVFTHTKLVLEALEADPEFVALPGEAKQDMRLAAFLHDIGKPARTVLEAGRITSPGHSRTGSVMAREMLWAAEWPLERREVICGLVKHHMLPHHAIDDAEPRRIIAASLSGGWQRLAMLSRADVLGRVSDDTQTSLERVALAYELAAELGCAAAPYPFASDHARFVYFRSEDRDPAYAAFDDTRVEVTVMSGFPGSGKDAWIARNGGELPVVSLDAVREKLSISPQDAQGRVLQEAREEARVLLRKQQPFIWNATNISRQVRGQMISLFADYGARVRVVAIETSWERLFEQNRSRDAVVPEAVLDKLLGKWEFPDLTECHQLEMWQSGSRIS